MELKPCPFCGQKFTDKSYDRGIVFECEVCGYRRLFAGWYQMTPNDNPVKYSNGDPITGLAKDPKFQEYLWNDAKEKAVDEMNRRFAV